MSLPRGSLGFLSDKAERSGGIGRIRDRLWGVRPDRGHFALPHAEANDCDRQPESNAQPLAHTKRSPPTDAGAPGHLPWWGQQRADADDGRGVDHSADPV